MQNEFSPLVIEPLADGTLDQAMQRGIAMLAWSPLAQGRLAVSAGEAPVEPRVAAVIHALDAVAVRSGTPRSAVASQNPARIREARSAYSVQLTREEWYRILVAARGARMP